MIKENSPLSMAEAKSYFDAAEEKESEVVQNLKKFVKINAKDAVKMREKLTELDLMKVSPKHISKIIDLMPEDAEELKKVFTDVGLDEDETKNILEIVKEFK